ncbi:tyrosyl-DNA phosphodiesterase-domain-containing protein [Mycena epipterygia]|nr:tyrosyl-DNA phosphodiesterase-domain-containing protein [Mycena epipterygia]
MPSNELLDAHEKNELQWAIALSLQDLASSSTGATSIRIAALSNKRPLADGSGPLRKKAKSERDSNNKALAASWKKMEEDRKRKTNIRSKYQGGALRLTRTPGRNHVNTVSLGDLIDPNGLSCAFVFSFFIENDYLFQHFPFKTSANHREHCLVYMGRDISMDPVAVGRRPKSAADFNDVVEAAQREYSETYGRNFRAFYPRMPGSGCAHSKIMILLYPDFMRVVITSANLMQLDAVIGDNTWFIQDFPRLSSDAAEEYEETQFERDLIQHLEDLACPEEFLDMYLTTSTFDFSAAKVHLVTSKPGSFSGAKAENYGQLRLRCIIRDEILSDFTVLPKMNFEVCVGSVGRLEAKDVVKNLLESCAGGRQRSKAGKPALNMVFPTYYDVQNSNVPGVGNISSHINWKALKPSAAFLKDIFYHYQSKDAGCMFHMKSILALEADKPDAPPLYMYVGSHNFSINAWGRVLEEKRPNVAGKGAYLRLANLANIECGVVVKGGDIAGMLETADWQDIVPYVRPSAANKYKEGERPYKAPPPPKDSNSPLLFQPDAEEDPEDDESW